MIFHELTVRKNQAQHSGRQNNGSFSKGNQNNRSTSKEKQLITRSEKTKDPKSSSGAYNLSTHHSSNDSGLLWP